MTVNHDLDQDIRPGISRRSLLGCAAASAAVAATGTACPPGEPAGAGGARVLGSPPIPATRDAPHEFPNGTLGHAFVLGACHPRWRTPADVRIH
jgi:hypothetical protein